MSETLVKGNLDMNERPVAHQVDDQKLVATRLGSIAKHTFCHLLHDLACCLHAPLHCLKTKAWLSMVS